MNLNFPSRFLRKLEIYQQIRSGQGLAKYKKLWPQEAALLQWGYEEHHQHLKNFIDYKRAKNEIASYIGKRVEDIGEVEQTLGNLYFKGLIDVKLKVKVENDIVSTINPPESQIAEIRVGKLKFRPSLYGLEVGEVISEIKNKHVFTKYKNLCEYELTLGTVWLVLILGLLKFVLGSFDDLRFVGCWYLAFFLLRVCQYMRRWGGEKRPTRLSAFGGRARGLLSAGGNL